MSTMGPDSTGNGKRMHWPPGLGIGTVRSRCEIYRSIGISDDEADK